MRYILLFISLFSVLTASAQNESINLTGLIKDKNTKEALAYAKVTLQNEQDTLLTSRSSTNEIGKFTFSARPGSYYLLISAMGYHPSKLVITLAQEIKQVNMGTIELEADTRSLKEVIVVGKRDEIGSKMDKKTFSVESNISQRGGSILQAMQTLPGITVQDGKIQLRGSDKIAVLIDSKQTAITGYGNQSGLDNIPASAIEKIEIINNPSSKYDANGNAGVINIIYKTEKREGFTGKVGLSTGLGAWWIKHENLPTIRPQYMMTPKFNPSVSLNYRKNKLNAFFQGDYLYTQTLNKNEFATRTYDDGTASEQQIKRNRNTQFIASKTGVDWNMNELNMFTLSALFGSEKILDRGDEPFFNSDLSTRLRLWQFLEDELKTTLAGTASFQHKFKQPGHYLNAAFTYTFHRENEKYFFDNILPTYTGQDAFKLISDEHVADLSVDYVRPLKYGKIESGLKFRKRNIPTDMLFIPGINSPLDVNAGGWATYKEIIPALYVNYIYNRNKLETEVGLRAEYVDLRYEVNPNHNTYKSDGYNYLQPFPTVRFNYKVNERNKLSLFYNRRVDRPNEIDIRIFPKYDDAEVIKVGNPALRPQFTNTIELGYKKTITNGYWYTSIYQRIADGTIARIKTIAPGSPLIYSIMQNTGKSYSTGLETLLSHDVNKLFTFNLNLNAYRHQFDDFTVINKYPVETIYTAPMTTIFSGSGKLTTLIHLPQKCDIQLAGIYYAPDLVPQGKVGSRFSLDLGIKKSIQNQKGELFLNATDLLNTMMIKEEIRGNGFSYTARDYYETQVIRIGYNYKF